MKILEQLKTSGYRLTEPRQEIIKVLKEYPQTAQEIHDLLKKKKVNIDLTSIYRSLELFVNMGIIYVIDLGENKKRYELIDKKNHHHHLVCNNCGKIEDVKINENFIEKEIEKKSSFKLDHHHLEFFGLCTSCQ